MIVVASVIGGTLLICGLLVGIGYLMQPTEPTTPAVAATTPARTTQAPPTPTAPATSAAPKLVAMPNLVGKNAAVAGDELERLGFTNVEYGSQDPNSTVVLVRSNWTVTKQSTAAGTQVSTDTLIVLTCTKG